MISDYQTADRNIRYIVFSDRKSKELIGKLNRMKFNAWGEIYGVAGRRGKDRAAQTAIICNAWITSINHWKRIVGSIHRPSGRPRLKRKRTHKQQRAEKCCRSNSVHYNDPPFRR